MLEKRGQVTVFIVVGILLLALIGVLLYFRHERAVEELPEIVPEQIAPVKTYIDHCLQKTTQKAVIILGMQGGYIYLPDRISYDPTSYVLVGGIKVPLWYYRGNSRIPTVHGMELEIERYVQENIDRCFAEFLSFEESFEITPEDNRTVNATIQEGKVNVKMKYPMMIRVKGEPGTYKISRFDADLDVKLKRVYSLGKEIMSAENSQMYLEDTAIDLMAAGKDIPFTDVLFECRQRRWYVPEIKERIQNLIFYNFPKIRIKGTDYIPFLEHYTKYELLRGYTPEDIAAGRTPKESEMPEDKYEYFHFLWDATLNDYKDLKANIYYQKDWDLKLVARPADGSIMKSSWGKGSPQYYLSFLCINAYHFTYDVIFPVEIILRDESAFEGQGYTFRYATPVMINHNEGDRSDFPIVLYDYPTGRGGEYCDDRYDNEVLIYAKDKKTLLDIPHVDIIFNCMNIYYCNLGETSFEYGVNRLRTSLPSFCQPPTIYAKHEDYATVSKTISKDATYTDLVMTPLKRMNFDVVKRMLSAGYLGDPVSLEPGESVVIYLSTDQLEDYDIFRKYPFDDDTPADMKYIKFPDDDLTYKVELLLLSRHNEIIGGFRGNWTVDSSELDGKSTITFNVLEQIPHPSTTEEQANMVVMLEGGAYNGQIMPVFT